MNYKTRKWFKRHDDTLCICLVLIAAAMFLTGPLYIAAFA